MHRLATIPGGWNPAAEGVIFVEQQPAPIAFITAADTDIQTLAVATTQLSEEFPQVRVVNLLQLQQQLTIDTYAEDVLTAAKVIIVRLIGGQSYWSYGLEVVQETARQTGAVLIVLPGDERPDPTLMSHSTASLADVDRVWQYLIEGGVDNYRQLLNFIASRWLDFDCAYRVAEVVPRVGIYDETRWLPEGMPLQGGAAIIFYRAHYLSGNLAAIEALCQALVDRNLTPVPIYVSSLKDPVVQRVLTSYCQQGVDVLLNTTSFSLASLDTDTPQVGFWATLNLPVFQVILSGAGKEFWESGWQGLTPRDMAMNVALPEVDGRIITRAISFKAVQTQNSALQTDVLVYEPVPDRVEFVAELALNWSKLRRKSVKERKVALILANYPTRDGRLANGVGLDTPQSCVEILHALKAAGYQVGDIPADSGELIKLLTAGVTNDPEGDGWRKAHQSLDSEEYWAHFQTLPIAVQQGIVERWGGDGVNPPVLSRFLAEETSSARAAKSSLERGTKNDRSLLEKAEMANPPKSPLERGTLNIDLDPIPPFLRGARGDSPSTSPTTYPIPGIQFGNVFVGIQPARGYDKDPNLNYHAPDLVPPHQYVAFYHWVKANFGADAIVHVGKHGNLEWLPGKSVALSENCYPEAVFGAMPHLYPFIVNDPGEGSQAKRRTQAVILDHLTPPMTRAELYGSLNQLEGLIDEYYEAQTLDPLRLAPIRDRLITLIQQEHLHETLGIPDLIPSQEGYPQGGVGKGLDVNSSDDTISRFLNTADGYLCELKEAQIRDGLHIFGQCPQDTQLRDLIVAIARNPNANRMGLTRAIALDWEWDFDPLTADLGEEFVGFVAPRNPPKSPFPRGTKNIDSRTNLGPIPPFLRGARGDSDAETKLATKPIRIIGDAVEILEEYAAELVQRLIETSVVGEGYPQGEPLQVNGEIGTHTQAELDWISTRLLPALQQTPQEMTNLLRGLNGEYIPSSASGAPTRGKPEVLPTGRNFYSVDIRAVPTETAWCLGRKAAEVLIDRYTQEHGEYPQTLGLSIWGTSTMRTGGDDIAQALALIGVQPVWDGVSRRVVDFEILPISILGRPRVDVTLRISGFFRDAFPNLIDLFDNAVKAVAALEETPEQNPLADRVQQEQIKWLEQGLTLDEAQTRSQYRIFGSKPGAYGAGLQGLIESQNWETEADLAQAYINWSAYAYTNKAEGIAAPEAFNQRLSNMQIVLQNQDNREHDLLDSDDYYQFQGGLTAAIKQVSGKAPEAYFGDNSRTENPKVRKLTEEIDRVYRSRVVNPKWIAGAMRHGYKGASEMAATLDFLFAYDATANCVQDFMYQGVADAYLFDESVREFIEQNNPWVQRDMAERLLEANQRGLWEDVELGTLERLRLMVNESEGVIESQGN
ncbi:cobaltochelatase subunit CobN [Chamaesiphon minutus]|uniref:Mg chelatase, cobalamin biosynthesis protein CobN n=1 Tax=Chamaesiphon minutus (strain ATCC 27169 / PCC 6605) TaxID=1173020 RepID=K9UK81_CHAP6|nr:cobaltochelatase subunit CobN [Chamaesiphon minutus]AFY94831.1 Mg chelatase, cobalamin biosynthesis protein CobN [Chamaesiphon minutus PCC 6605]